MANRTQVGSVGGTQVFVEYGQGIHTPQFVAEPEEGHLLTGLSYKEVIDRIDRYFALEEKRARTTGRAKLAPVPVVRLARREEDVYGVFALEAGFITGIHSGNNHPIIKIGTAPAGVESYHRDGYLCELSKVEIERHEELAKTAVEAVKAYQAWVASRKIKDLNEHFQKHQPKKAG